MRQGNGKFPVLKTGIDIRFRNDTMLFDNSINIFFYIDVFSIHNLIRRCISLAKGSRYIEPNQELKKDKITEQAAN
jgi:hypothetical protein